MQKKFSIYFKEVTERMTAYENDVLIIEEI